jgi:GT2 family glycosyltransferase
MVYTKTCIILVNYNSIEDTIECVKSISLVIGDLPHVVVVDNASNNQKDIKDHLSFYPKLKIILNRVNVGFGKANNIGIDWVFDNIQCDYVFILNNDTLIDEASISLLEQAFLNASNDVVLVAPKILINDNHSEIWYEGATINFKRVTPSRTFNNGYGFTEFASGCSMFFKHDYLKKLKGFDPFFFMYDEDVELSLRVTKQGLKILYLPEAVIYHKCQGSQTKQKNIPGNQLHPNHPSLLFYLKNTIVNRRYIINKHLRGFEKFESIIYHTIYWLMKSFQYFIFGKTKAGIDVLKCLFFTPLKHF